MANETGPAVSPLSVRANFKRAKISWERPPSLSGRFSQLAIAGSPQARMSGDPRKFQRRYDEKQFVCSLPGRNSISCWICLGLEFVKLRAIRAQTGADADAAKGRAVFERFGKGESYQSPPGRQHARHR